MSNTLSVSIDLSDLLSVGPVIRSGVFTHLSAAVRATVEVGEERWKRAVLKAPLWEGERQAYAASISAKMTGPFSGEISSNYRYVQDIESGRPAYDMKRMLNSSMKVRVSKKGRRYLIIPFRHNTPGNTAHASAMPSAIYGEAKQMSFSRVLGGYGRVSGTGALSTKTRQPFKVAARKYSWGDRLAAGVAGAKPQPGHKTDLYAGMVRFKETTGGSKYLTFRVMAEGSSGWIMKAKPGLFIAKAVADSVRRTAERDWPAALAQDVG